MTPMGLLADGDIGEVTRVLEGNRADERVRMEELGLRAGKTVQVLANRGRSAMLVRVDESRIALGRSAAMRVLVRVTR